MKSNELTQQATAFLREHDHDAKGRPFGSTDPRQDRFEGRMQRQPMSGKSRRKVR